MNLFKWLISSITLILAFSWAIRLHDYFYGLVPADQFSLAATLLVSFVALRKVAVRLENRSVIVLICLISLPFLFYLLIYQSVVLSAYSWLLVHLLLVLSALGVRSLLNSRLLFCSPLAFVAVFFVPFHFQKEQLRFYDRLESSIETRNGEAQIVQWKQDFWLYYNSQLQFSTVDKHMFQEAYVQPVMQFADEDSPVLLIGGDNGMVESELSKFSVSLTILPLDPEFHDFSRSNENLSFQAVSNRSVLEKTDVFHFLSLSENKFDIVIIDTPDPMSLDYSQYYTLEFYQLVNESLKENGYMVTQSGDLFKNGGSVRSIWNSVEKSGFNILPSQCQIPTIGHWSWVLGSKKSTPQQMKEALSKVNVKETVWWNQEAADLMFSFGKDYFSNGTTAVNTLNIVDE